MLVTTSLLYVQYNRTLKLRPVNCGSVYLVPYTANEEQHIIIVIPHTFVLRIYDYVNYKFIECKLTNSTYSPRSSSLPLSLVSSRSVLAIARDLDPSAYLTTVPTNDGASVAKVMVSFVQIIATTPVALVVRHSDSLRSFLGGLDMANFSAPKVTMVTDDLTLFTMGTILWRHACFPLTPLFVARCYIKSFAPERIVL